MIPNIFLEPFLAIGTHHEPYLQCPETSGQGDLPVAIVDDRTRIRGCVAQIRRMDGECVNQLISFFDKEATKLVSLVPSEDQITWLDSGTSILPCVKVHQKPLR